MTRRATRALELLAAGGLAAALAIELTGGGTFTAGPLRLGLRDPTRPAILAGIALIARWVIGRRLTRGRHDAPPRADAAPRRGDALRRPSATEDTRADAVFSFVCLVICLTSIGVWLAVRVGVCGGLDSYAYVSFAHLIAGGRFYQPAPIAAILPFEHALRAAAPFGYIPALDGAGIVPEFPPGLPVLMAAFLKAFGSDGPFWVAPVFGIAGVAATFGAARRAADAMTAWLAAVLVAVHPVFVTQAIQPMSDVPATAALMASVYWLLSRRPALAGLAAGLAVWIRPPLILPAGLGVLFLISAGLTSSPAPRTPGSAPEPQVQSPNGPKPIAESLWYLSTLGACIGLLALLQWHLYGSPFTSGRGSAAHLFEAGRVSGNLWNYAKWFTILHTPLVFVALAAGLWKGRLGLFGPVALLVAASETLPYLAYVQFDDWETLRYWLPVIPLLAIISARGLTVLMQPVPLRWRGGVAAALAIVIAASAHVFLSRTATYTLTKSEQRYIVLGEWLRVHTPADAVVIASTHSGSIRFYGHRLTLRWDDIPPERLADTVRAIHAQGRTCLVAIDGAEDFLFRRRFPPQVFEGLAVYPAGGLRDMAVISLEPRGK